VQYLLSMVSQSRAWQKFTDSWAALLVVAYGTASLMPNGLYGCALKMLY
jgi:hypothetical protein